MRAQGALLPADFGWHPQLDNPNFLGWSVVAFYELAALACARAAVRAQAQRAGGETDSAGMWWALAAGLGFLGVNKQLNLQTLFLVLGRHLAAADGWYGERRAVQLAFSLLFGLGVVGLLFRLESRHRDFVRSNPLVFRGALILGLFVALRSATINHANEWLGLRLEVKPWTWVLEIGGSVLIGAGAMLPRRSSET